MFRNEDAKYARDGSAEQRGVFLTRRRGGVAFQVIGDEFHHRVVNAEPRHLDRVLRAVSGSRYVQGLHLAFGGHLRGIVVERDQVGIFVVQVALTRLCIEGKPQLHVGMHHTVEREIHREFQAHRGAHTVFDRVVAHHDFGRFTRNVFRNEI